MDDAATGNRSEFALGFHGRSGEIFGIFIVNLLLTIVTLGFYRFWGKTRLRRYLWNHMSVGGDRLEYTGTGKELFIGFLIVVFLVLLPLFGGVEAWKAYTEISAPELVFIPEICQTIAIFYLIPVALYRARRYRLTRTQWRGIRGGQSGSAWAYGAISLAYYVLTVLSLGLAWPYFSVRLTTFKMANTWFGDRRVAFEASSRALYRTFLKVWALYLLLTLVPVAGAALYGITGETNIEVIGISPAAEGDEMGWFSVTQLLLLLTLPVAFFVFRIPWLWYRAAETRYFAGQIRYEGLAFAARVSGGRLVRLTLGNLFITIVTIGLGLPIVYRRIGTFLAECFHIEGEQDMEAIRQSTAQGPKTGEGLADAFDIGEF